MHDAAVDEIAVLEGVSKSFGGYRALDGIDLTVSRGEIRGFLGPNGAGKTTAMRILVGLLRADDGRVALFGADPWSTPSVRAGIGFLPSDPGLYGRMTGRGLLDHFAALSRREPILRTEACRHLRMTDQDLDRQVRTYSKGMRQKLGVLQAVQHDPDLLILDEPGEGLDPLVLTGLVALLRERRDAGRAILFSSHVLAEVQALCDEIVMINGGRIIGVGSIADLARQGSRRITIDFRSTPDDVAIDGAEVVDRTATRLVLTHHGPVRPLLEAIAALDPLDARIEEAPLDEVFLEYYGDAGATR